MMFLAIIGGVVVVTWGLAFMGGLLGLGGHEHVFTSCSAERWSEHGRITTVGCACGQTCDIERLHNGSARITRNWG